MNLIELYSKENIFNIFLIYKIQNKLRLINYALHLNNKGYTVTIDSIEGNYKGNIKTNLDIVLIFTSETKTFDITIKSNDIINNDEFSDNILSLFF